MKRTTEVKAGERRLILRNRTNRTETVRAFYLRALVGEVPGLIGDPMDSEDAAKYATVLAQTVEADGVLIPEATGEAKLIREGYEQYLEDDPRLWAAAWAALDDLETGLNAPEKGVDMPIDPNSLGRGGNGKNQSGNGK